MKLHNFIRAALAGVVLLALPAHSDAQSIVGQAGIGKPFSNLQDSIALNFVFPQQGPTTSETGAPLGVIRTYASAFGVTTSSETFPLADGRAVVASSNLSLTTTIGNAFGGTTTGSILVPNAAGRALGGVGTGAGLTNWARGAKRGTPTVTLTDANLPSHVHPLPGGGATTPTSTAAPTPYNNLQPSLGVNYIIRTSGVHPIATAGGISYMGMVAPFAGGTVPAGWALCDGATLNPATNQALYSTLGTTFGGNGITTFMLPDLRGRTIVGAGERPGSSGSVVGERFGFEQQTISIATMPTHTHVISPGVTTGPAGGGMPIDNRQPSMALTYAIAAGSPFPQPFSGQFGEEIVMGEVVAFAYDRVPDGYLLADGRTLNMQEYPALASLLGSTYGGDGMTTFKLPDLRARTIIGAGPSAVLGSTPGQPQAALVDAEGNFVYDLGETAGASDAPLESDNLPSHSHVVAEPASCVLALAVIVGGLAIRRRR